MRAIPERLRGAFTTKRYTNPRLPLPAYMQNRLTNSQRYLVNTKPGTNHSTNPTNPNGNSKQ